MKKLLVLFLIVQTFSAYSQSPYFQQYFLLKKNDPVQIEAIMKDRTGFMWFGTNKGLFKFDGIDTRRFTTSDSLSSNFVTALAQDSLGRIWIGHKTGQLSVIENDVIRKHTFPEGDATQPVSDILFAADGTMWFSTLNDGLYFFNEHLYRVDEENGMPDLFVYDLEEAGDGTIWAGTDRGVAVVGLDGRKAKVTVLDYRSGFPDNIIKKISRDDNRMWLATEDAGIFSYDLTSKKTTSLTKSPWSAGGISDFIRIGDAFWIANSTSDIFVYNRSDDQLSIYKPGPGLAATKVFLDQEGSVWIGSRNGLFRSLGRDVRFIDDVSPAHDANIVAITVDQEGSIWFSSDEGLFRRSTSKDGKVEMQQFLTSAPYNKYNVISLYTDSQGFVWCGSYGQGVLRIDPRSGKITSIDKQLTNGNVLSISGKDNKVWLSTLSGASMIDISNNLAVTNYDRSKGLNCDYVYQVFVDSKDRTWFASDREGVAMLDKDGFHKMVGSLAARAVYGFTEDGAGNIWANVQDDGVFLFDGKEFRPEQILKNVNVNCLGTDQAGNIIAVHDLGIEIIDPQTKTTRHLDNEIGYGDRRPNLNAVAKDIHGNLFFGTDQGIVIYDATSSPAVRPTARVDRFRVFNQYKPMSPDLKLSYDENNITISFLGFWYKHPLGVQFQYKLENYDVDWISTGDRSAVFSSLPPGDYTFRVRASVNSDFTNATEDSVSFTIRPPFWRTIPFYVAVGFIVVFSGYTFMRGRERRLVKDKVILEEKVVERTLEIMKKNEEIQAQAEEIKAINESLEKRVAERTFELERKNKTLEEYAFINAHKLRAPVASILGLINLLTHTKQDDDAKLINQHLKTSADNLDDVVRTITESIEQGDRMEGFDKIDEDEGID